MNKIYPFFTKAHSLTTWLIAGVGVFVCVGSVVLVIYFQHLTKVEEEVRLEFLAKNNARFLLEARLPQSEVMADRIGRVMGARVEFRETGGAVVYGKVIRDGDRIQVAHELGQGREVWFTRDADETGASPVWRRWDSLLLLGGFWGLALLLSWWLARRIARPISRLAELVPRVGGDAPFESSASLGPAEIQSLAVVLEQTQRALLDERDRRRQSERLAILGKMAASLAHEVRNPVSAIKLHGQLLERELMNGERDSARHVIDEAERIESLVLQWMCYAKPDSYVMDDVDVVGVLGETMAAMRAQADHAGVEMRLEDRGDRLMVRGDAARLLQALRNLLQNAIQSMPEGGVVSVSVDGHSVEIRDQGTGFRQEALEHYGEAFFSQREGGMGLGVAVSKEILEHHGARLFAENHAEGGALIRIDWGNKPERILS